MKYVQSYYSVSYFFTGSKKEDDKIDKEKYNTQKAKKNQLMFKNV